MAVTCTEERGSIDKLNEIFCNLRKGCIYGTQISNVRYPYFSAALWYDSAENLFGWRHYGSSANKATKEELRWIIKSIFDMTPEEFSEAFELRGDLDEI